MSAAKHTPGLLRVAETTPALLCAEALEDRIVAQALDPIPHIGHKSVVANARRLAAAWNACDGISTEALEGGAVRDLLEALQMWLTIHDSPAVFAGKYGRELDAAIAAQGVKVGAAANAARAAIAKATGSAA